MSNARVRTVTIEADNAEDAVKQLREQLGGDVPQEVLDIITSKVLHQQATSDLEQMEKDYPTGKRPFDLVERAESIADLPPEARGGAALRSTVLELAESLGIPAERAMELTRKSINEVQETLGRLGVKVPKEVSDSLSAEAVTGKASEAKAGPAKSESSIKDEFGVAVEKIVAKHGRKVASQMAHFYRHQDDLLSVMQYAAHEAIEHDDAASAKLYLHVESYVSYFNRFIFNHCRDAGVNPAHLGFSDEKTYYDNLQHSQLAELRSRCIELSTQK